MINLLAAIQTERSCFMHGGSPAAARGKLYINSGCEIYRDLPYDVLLAFTIQAVSATAR